jgi:hypothetical protein
MMILKYWVIDYTQITMIDDGVNQERWIKYGMMRLLE